jgi:hypothetical protein
MLVRTWMSEDPVTISPHVRMKEAADLRREREALRLKVATPRSRGAQRPRPDSSPSADQSQDDQQHYRSQDGHPETWPVPPGHA